MEDERIIRLRELVTSIDLDQLSNNDLNEFIHIVSSATIHGNNALNARNI